MLERIRRYEHLLQDISMCAIFRAIIPGPERNRQASLACFCRALSPKGSEYGASHTGGPKMPMIPVPFLSIDCPSCPAKVGHPCIPYLTEAYGKPCHIKR